VIELRPWQAGDLPLLEQASADEYVTQIEHLPTPFSSEAALAWIAGRTGTEWAIVADGQPVGGAGFAERHVPNMADAGYWVVAGRRGSGIATAAVEILVSRAFAAGIQRLQAVVEPWNLASQRVLEKTGFEREGLLRGYLYYGDGPRRDVYLYARLA